VLVEGHLYGHNDKEWVCQNLKTGDIVWRNPGVGKGSVTLADGLLVCRAEAKDKDGPSALALVVPTPEGYIEKGRFEQPDRSSMHAWPHPTISGGRLYVRDQDILLCYDLKTK
jgi:hypothetical protein